MAYRFDRFLTTHTGSLPRPDDLIRAMFAKEEGVPVDRARDHHLRPGSACACTNRRALPLGHHPIAGPGPGRIWLGAARSRLRRSAIYRAMGTSACGSQGAARRLAQKGRVGQRDSKEYQAARWSR